MSEPKPLTVLTSADDVLDVMMEHYVDGDFGYFREGDASAAIWACVEATIAAQNARIADIEYELSDAQKLYERFRDAEKRLSSSYVNLRRILGTLDIDYEGVSDMWAKTEAAARGAVTRIEAAERDRIPPERLRMLADWVDLKDAQDGRTGDEVQRDLRAEADAYADYRRDYPEGKK